MREDVFSLHWTRLNSIELIISYIVLAIIAGTCLYITSYISNSHLRLVLILSIITVPFVSLIIHAMRQLGLRGNLLSLSRYINSHMTVGIVIATSVMALFILLIIIYQKQIFKVIIITIYIVSPMNVLALGTITKSIFDAGALTQIDLNNNDIGTGVENSEEGDIVVLLFDEMSYQYLYDDGDIRDDFPNIKKFSMSSDNYHKAISPGNATSVAIPGLLMGKKYDSVLHKGYTVYEMTKDGELKVIEFEGANLFTMAKRKGYRTKLYGVGLPYCELFKSDLNGCDAFSLYNHSTVHKGISIIDPIFTTIAIWPHQYPTGLLMVPILSKWQREVTSIIHERTMDAINDGGRTFLFAHFFIPHLPFVFNRDGYYTNDDPFNQNSENYNEQLKYVDTVFGEIVETINRNNEYDKSHIILMSDHNYRKMYQGDKKNEVPLIIKKRNQKDRRDIYERVETEKILWNTLSNDL